MLTIHSGINRNVNMKPNFGRKEDFERSALDLEMDAITHEYSEERDEWVEQKRSFEEMVQDKEAQLPKPVKTVMKGGAILAAGVLGGMATGYSAKYIMNSFKKMANSKQVKSFGKKFEANISAPIKKGIKAVKTYVEKQIAKVKTSKSFVSNKAKVEKKFNGIMNSKFVKSIKKFGKDVANNKFVKPVIGFVDKVFSKFADGVVAVYNKLAKVNYKETTADALGVAGGISTGAVALMDECKDDGSLKKRTDDMEI